MKAARVVHFYITQVLENLN